MTAASNEVALLPCPFCGGEWGLGQEPDDNYPFQSMWYLYHKSPRCFWNWSPPHFANRDAAVFAWNHRIAHSDPRPVAEGLREAIIAAITEADGRFGYSYRMTKMDESGEEHTLFMDGFDPAVFEDRADGYPVIERRRNTLRTDAILAALATHSPAPMAGKGWEGPAYEYGVTWGPEDAHPDARAKKVLADTTKSAGALWVDIGGNEWVSVRDALAAMHQFAGHPSTQEGADRG